MKRLLCVFLMILMLVPMLAVGTSAEVYSGTAVDIEAVVKANTGKDNFTQEELEFFESAVNNKIQYTLDTQTGVLDIFCGTNEDGTLAEQHMLSYIAPHWVPWQNETPGEFNSDIVNMGETAVVKFDPSKAVLQMVKTVRIHEGVGSVGRYSLNYSNSIEEIYLPHSIQKIDRQAIYQCKNLKAVYYAGTEEDFRKIYLDEVRNWNGTDTDGSNGIDAEEVEKKLKDMIHFGESVTVVCKNEEGDTITKYTVGGYFPGDEYAVQVMELEGLTFVGKQSEITGKFKKNDSRVLEFVYHCDHDYQQRFSSAPCSSFCTKCGRANPDYHDMHTWSKPIVVSERGFLTPLNQSIICEKCNAKVSEYKEPYGPLISICVAGPILLAGIVAAIVIPIRKRKKMKDMTW